MNCSKKRWGFFKVVVFGMAVIVWTAILAQPGLAKGSLMTRWATEVGADSVHAEYPRPQMVREDWMNLNGLWEYSIAGKDESKPISFDGQILVPFCVESALSGVTKAVGEGERLWYRRTFELPDKWAQRCILLHFGAVDWETRVWINGKEVGTHRGGYDAFTFDITKSLNDTNSQEIVLSVWDPTDRGFQPRGKQVRKPGGIWYTAVTGIWQTVWLEPVGRAYIKSLKIVPDVDAEAVRVTAVCSDVEAGYSIEAKAKDGEFTKAKAMGEVGQEFIIPIKEAKLWSPDSPFLYDLIVILNDGEGKKVDEVESYFGMRKVSLGSDDKGITRIFLNNEPLFMFGPLDQGWWPDGLYTAPTDEALRYDIEVTKQLGFNMARKHVKVEPARWYYWCDKLGLLVWQDIPSGDRYIGKDDVDIERSEESSNQFELELRHIIETFGNRPSIVMWVAFNEGWGQYDTGRIIELIKHYDPTRLVNSASGWADREVGDVHDVHSYPGPAAPSNESGRAAVLGEFGGLGLPVKGHTWQDEKNWGYRSFETKEELTDGYLELLSKLQPLIDKGLSAAVYTQTSDVEIEVNGLMTYDRAIIKMDTRRIADANRRVISRSW
jgi:beta-galactosidase/beta-glucuronidase